MKYSFRTYVAIISFMMVLAQMAADLYLPALPDMALALHSNIVTLEKTMFFYTVGYLLGALFYGPLSDRIGRRKVIFISLVICIIGSIFCVNATTITAVFIGRIIQGLGFGGVNLLARTMIKDISKDLKQMTIAGMVFNMFWAVGIALSPCIGGYIVTYLGWQAEFIILIVYAIAVLLLGIFVLDETNLSRLTTSFITVGNDYLQVFLSGRYLLYAFSSAAGFGLLLAYLTASPAILMIKLHLSATQYGYTNILLAVGIICGSVLNRHLAKTYSIDSLIFAGGIIVTLIGLFYLVCGYYNWLNVFLIILPMFIFGVGLLLVLPNTSNGAVGMFGKIAGSAAAAFTFIQMLGGSSGSALVTMVHHENQIALGAIMILFGSIIILAARKLLQSELVLVKA